MQNETWNEFKQRVWGTDYEIWHDGIESGGLDFYIQKEGSHVKEMLLKGLEAEDPTAVLGLYSFPADEIVDDLKKAFSRSASHFKIELAKLLYTIDEENRGAYRDTLIDRLQNAGDPGVQIAAAEAMSGFNDEAMQQALTQASKNADDNLVRAAALRSL